RIAAARRLLGLAVLALHDECRLEVAAARIGPPVDHHALGDAGRLVGGFHDRDTVDEVLVLGDAVDLGQHRTGIGIPFGEPRAADVEGAHGELGARLADRLRRDDADRLAEIDRRAAGKIAPVALGADAVLGLAGEHRTDADRLYAALLDLLDVAFVDGRAGG